MRRSMPAACVRTDAQVRSPSCVPGDTAAARVIVIDRAIHTARTVAEAKRPDMGRWLAVLRGVGRLPSCLCIAADIESREGPAMLQQGESGGPRRGNGAAAAAPSGSTRSAHLAGDEVPVHQVP